jgi:hypothetical protein
LRARAIADGTHVIRVVGVDAREGETVMKKLLAVAALSALAVPGAGVRRSSAADQAEGKRDCRTALRTVETRANFVELVKLEARANPATPSASA